MMHRLTLFIAQGSAFSGLFSGLVGTKLMDGPSDSDIVFAAIGAKCNIVYARCRNGVMEAKVFLDENAKHKKAFGPLIQYLADHARITNDDLFSKMEGMDDVWEFRKGGNRLFCVSDGGRWLLTHPYAKGHSNKHQTRAAQRALVIAAEHKAWEAEKKQEKTQS